MNLIDASFEQDENEEPLQNIDSISITTPKIDWFINNIQSSRPTSHLKECIINGSVLAVSDGSYFPLTKTGSCTCIISTPSGQKWIHGGGILPGEEEEQNNYRSELLVSLGVAVFMDCIQYRS